MTDWKAAQKKAAWTARWAVTMAKVRIRRMIARTRWQLVTFNGSSGQEPVGIIDLLAVRKNHRPAIAGVRRGDLLDVVLIQVKGGSAGFPSIDELARLRMVGRAYRAKAILLAQWKQGRQSSFYRLKRIGLAGLATPRDAWEELESPDEVFY
jgi:hypothetical protein